LAPVAVLSFVTPVDCDVFCDCRLIVAVFVATACCCCFRWFVLPPLSLTGDCFFITNNILLSHLLSLLTTLLPTWPSCCHFSQRWLRPLFLLPPVDYRRFDDLLLVLTLLVCCCHNVLLPLEGCFHLDLIEFWCCSRCRHCLHHCPNGGDCFYRHRLLSFVMPVDCAVFCDRWLIVAVFVATACCFRFVTDG